MNVLSPYVPLMPGQEVRILRFVVDSQCNQIAYTVKISGVPMNFFRGGVQQIQLRTEDRENGDLRAVAP
jgi:hypothetical protein